MIEPINILGAIRQRWRLIVVLAVIGAVICLAMPVSAKKKPTTTPLLWETYATVGTPSSGGAAGGNVSTAEILFYANTFPVKLDAVAAVGLKGNPYAFAGGMFGSTTAPAAKHPYPTAESAATVLDNPSKASDKGLVTLYAAAETPELAAELCNEYAKELGNTLEQAVAAHDQSSLPSSSTKSHSSGAGPSAIYTTGYQVVYPGLPELAQRINKTPVGSFDSHKVRLVIGLAGGVGLALLVILAREILNRTIRRPNRAELHCKFPVVAVIPETYPPDPSVVDVVDRPTSPAAEAYRKLRMSVLFESLASESAASGAGDSFADMFGMAGSQIEPYKVPEPGSRSVLLVVSSIDEPSRPKVVANLAATFAEAAERVIVISTGDLEVGTTLQAESFLPGPVTPADIEERLTPAGPDNVWMLSMRQFMRNSGQLVLRSKEVFDAARGVADTVIVEAPAFLRYHHGEAVIHSVDAVIVVVENDVTTVPDAQDMGDVLRRLGAPVLGVVFTGEELSRSQRQVLDAGMAASGRHRKAIDAGIVDGVGQLGAEQANDDEAAGVAAELRPS